MISPPDPAADRLRQMQQTVNFLAVFAALSLIVCLLVIGGLLVDWLKKSRNDSYQGQSISIYPASNLPIIDKNDPILAGRFILITGDIDQRASRMVISQLLYLNRSDPTRPVNLLLNSDGGQKTDAFAIIDAMRSVKAPVNTWAVGNCTSAAAMILVGGTGKRYATPGAKICLHANDVAVTESNKWAIEGVLTGQVDALWKKHAKLPGDWYPLSGEERWYNMTPRQALQYGIIDEIRLLPPL